MVPLAAAVAGLLVYFVYNGIVFGGFVPVSGAVKEMWGQWAWVREGGYSLVGNLQFFVQARPFDGELLVALEVCAYGLLVLWLSGRFASREGRLLLAFMVGMFGLAAGHLAKFGHSVLFVHPWFGSEAWHFVPAYLMEALVVPVRFFVGIYALRWIGAALPRTANVLCIAGVSAAGMALVAKADFAAPFRLVDAYRESNTSLWRLHPYMGAEVMNRVLPTDVLVGSWDSGIFGYFARFPVVNLDGLANSYGYLQARRYLGRQRESTLPDKHGLSYYGNGISDRSESYDLLPDGASFVFKTYETPEDHDGWGRPSFALYCVRDGCSSWFKERMASRLEPQPDGTRLVVSGRVAQAFATQCAADDFAAWAWGMPEERTLSAWTRNPDGSCSSFVMLPRGHLPPLRVRRVAHGEALAHLVGKKAPEIQAKFDVFQTGNRLLYARETCDWADVKTRFFLHLVPVGDDWDAGREPYGFNNADFMLEEHGSWSGEVGSPCLAEVPLPEYPIATITTGQFTSAGRVWDGEILP